jgi:hypothetical protein
VTNVVPVPSQPPNNSPIASRTIRLRLFAAALALAAGVAALIIAILLVRSTLG